MGLAQSVMMYGDTSLWVVRLDREWTRPVHYLTRLLSFMNFETVDAGRSVRGGDA